MTTTGSDSRRFARALLRVATSLGVEEAFLDRFGFLARVFRENKAFRHLLITHRVPVEEKMDILHQVFGRTLTVLEFEVLRQLLEKGMGMQLPKIARSLVIMAQREGIRVDLTITTPQALPAQELQDLGERVGVDLDQSLRVTGIADPALLGGMKLRLGNTLIDGSLVRRLELLREQLV